MADNKKLLILGGAAVALFFLLKHHNASAQTPGYDPALIAAFIAKMKADTLWYDSEVSKAATNGITIDEQLLLDAKWMIDNGYTL